MAYKPSQHDVLFFRSIFYILWLLNYYDKEKDSFPRNVMFIDRNVRTINWIMGYFPLPKMIWPLEICFIVIHNTISVNTYQKCYVLKFGFYLSYIMACLLISVDFNIFRPMLRCESDCFITQSRHFFVYLINLNIDSQLGNSLVCQKEL